MSRMLKALRELQARSAQPQQPPESAPPGQLDSQPQAPPDDVSQVDATAGPAEAVTADAAIERALARIEDAAAAVAQQEDAGPCDRLTHAYAQLADNILAQAPPGRSAVLMFTSAGNGEGKTETLVSLAAALAERTPGGVLLVDGNLRKPDLADRLGIKAARGLGDVLIGVAGWQQVVQKTSVPHLNLLPGVEFPSPDGRPPEQLNLEALLEELRGQYRLVLIDTASLAYREVASIARYCDGTYLVVRLKYTTRRALAEAARVIQDCRGRLLGGVVIEG